MNSPVSSLSSGIATALNGSKKLTPGAFAKVVDRCLDQAGGRIAEVDSSAKELKDFALQNCRDAGRLLEQMKSGAVEAGDKKNLQPSQLEWKGQIQRACYSVYAAAALEGRQAAQTGLGPRAYLLPSQMEGEKPAVFSELMDYSKRIHERAQWVTHQAETSTQQESGAELLKAEVQQRLDSDRDTPKKFEGGGMSWGHVKELLSVAYDTGAQAGVAHYRTQG